MHTHQLGYESFGSDPVRIVVPEIAVARDEVAEEAVEEQQAEDYSEAIDDCDEWFFVFFADFLFSP